jgi:DNA-binding CsgD family transcriptional regulator
MFEALLSQLVSRSAMLHQRPEGVAFFRLAKNLYKLSSVAYLGVNIPTACRRSVYVHCTYSDTNVKHCINNSQICADAIYQFRVVDDKKVGILVIPLTSHFGETALFGVKNDTHICDCSELGKNGLEKFGVLGNYFHSHVLRINGHDCDDNILLSARELACLNAITVEKKGRDVILSARELDCLQWAAAGKTAWEASVILGITERTVRFHLNAAREKLACATTTQAVAKAVVSQLIHV